MSKYNNLRLQLCDKIDLDLPYTAILAFLIFFHFKNFINLILDDAQECGVNYFKCKNNGRKCIIYAFPYNGKFDCDDDDEPDENNCEVMFQ